MRGFEHRQKSLVEDPLINWEPADGRTWGCDVFLLLHTSLDKFLSLLCEHIKTWMTF